MSKTLDVAIIGAGIMGCSCAHELARRGLEVGVLEKDTIGAGSTGKSSALIRQHYSNELTARMALRSLRAFESMEEELGEGGGFTRTGFIAVTAAKDHAGLKANVALQHRVGIRSELLSPEALREVMPELEISDLVAAAYEPDAGYADPHLTVNAYANAARRHGAVIHLKTPVTGVRFSGDKVVGVDTPDERYDAGLVLNCAGPWGARVARLAGVELPIDACRTQVAFLQRPPGHEAPHPSVADFIHATYFRPETGNITVTGLIDPAEADAVVDPDQFDELHDDEFMLYVGERVGRRYPALRESRCAGGYASLYAITPDWHPIVDEVPTGSGFFACTGFSGHGFKLGPAVGVMVADLLTQVAEPEFPPHLFRFARYAENDPVQGRYEYSIAG
jgi:glycine/D-amino acid oxidase-like deaminating enzyme